jgi:hypothetical protein
MKTKHAGGEWRVRTTVDESGDYPFPEYNIIAIHKWGPEGVACAYQNPYNARLIASAPEMLETLIKVNKWRVLELDGNDFPDSLRSEIINVLEKATGQTIEELMEDGA